MRPHARVKCQKRPPAKNFVKKDPLRVAAPLARRHVARAVRASAGRPLSPAGWALPPSSLPARYDVSTMLYSQVNIACQATSPAANGGGGMVLPPHLPPMVVAAWCCHLTSDYRMPGCRQWQRRQGPAGTGPGGTCHVSPSQGCRHS
jgi:hypothetical protein